MGFLDLGGSLGRRFGSLGVGLEEISLEICLESSAKLEISGPGAERAKLAAENLSEVLKMPLPARIRIEREIPAHSGLGSGTQLALAVGVGLACLHRLPHNVRSIANMQNRGSRSGIGVAVFERGGMVLDGGHGSATTIPPVVSRLEMPADWRFILVLDHADRGLHGAAEIAAFKELPVFPPETAARLCHALLLKGLPAVAEGDIMAFGSVVSELQSAVGDHFAKAQGGRFTSPAVATAIEWLANAGAVGVGQSSWGPTGFCLVNGEQRARHLLDEIKKNHIVDSNLEFIIASPRNHGALVIESTDTNRSN